MTLNPLAHLDPLGTLMILLVGFGWGKPTPFDPYNLQNPKRDSALIAVSGAVLNFLMAGAMSGLYLLNLSLFRLELSFPLVAFISIFVRINLLLGVFNLIPIHPLDGFKVLGGFLPRNWYYDWIQMERYGFIILLFLIFTGVIGRIIFPITTALMNILLPGMPLII
jgi:Zn-dependent protease